MDESFEDNENQLANVCKTRKEFVDRYIEKFGLPGKLNHIDSVWKHRREKAEPKTSPVTISRRPLVAKPADAFPDVGEVLIGMSNKLGEVVQLLKELNIIEADRLMVQQYFERREQEKQQSSPVKSAEVQG